MEFERRSAVTEGVVSIRNSIRHQESFAPRRHFVAYFRSKLGVVRDKA